MNITKVIKPIVDTIQEKHFDLEKAVDSYLETMPPHDRSKGFHCSSVAKLCPREEILNEMYPRAVTKTYTGREQRIFMHGTALHTMMQNEILGPAKLLIGGWNNGKEIAYGVQPDPSYRYEELQFVYQIEGLPETDEWRIVGSTDGILINGSIFELKSCGSSTWKGLDRAYKLINGVNTDAYKETYFSAGENVMDLSEKVSREHSSQARIYTELLIKEIGKNLPGPVIVYYEKDKDNLKAFPIEHDSTPFKLAVEKIKMIYEAKQNKTLPKRICESSFCSRAVSCPQVINCFSNPN